MADLNIILDKKFQHWRFVKLPIAAHRGIENSPNAEERN
jgi:hypothetical protein